MRLRNMKLIKTRDYLIIALISVIGLILGGIFDRQVTVALYKESSLNGLGVVLSNYLLLPFFIVTLSLGIIGFYSVQHKGTVIRIIFSVIYAGLALFMLYQEYDKIGDIKEIYGKVGGLINVIVCLLFTICLASFIAYRIIKKYDKEELFRLSLSAAIIVGVALVALIFLKYFFSRPRPWWVFGNDYLGVLTHPDDYRAFWEIHPFEAFKNKEFREYFKSFPSNHTNTALMVLPTLLIYTKLDEKFDNDRSRTLIIYSALCLGLLVALARMIAGAHFLSDVSAGILVAYTVSYVGFVIADSVFNKIETVKA